MRSLPRCSTKTSKAPLPRRADRQPFGSLLATYLAVKGPGFYLKLPGKVEADPVTGQLTATFDDSPQLPFDRLRSAPARRPQGAAGHPRRCGTYETQVR